MKKFNKTAMKTFVTLVYYILKNLLEKSTKGFVYAILLLHK